MSAESYRLSAVNKWRHPIIQRVTANPRPSLHESLIDPYGKIILYCTIAMQKKIQGCKKGSESLQIADQSVRQLERVSVS